MRTLYLGIDPSRYVCQGELIHYPIIRTVPVTTLAPNIADTWPLFTHLLFTSPSAVRHWAALSSLPMHEKQIFAVGPSTQKGLQEHGWESQIPSVATQEGLVDLLQTMEFRAPFFFWPRSSRARSILGEYLCKRGITCISFDLYETIPQKLQPVPDLDQFDQIVFTSPSTVEAFLKIYSELPEAKKIVPLGPITQHAILNNIIANKVI